MGITIPRPPPMGGEVTILTIMVNQHFNNIELETAWKLTRDTHPTDHII